MATPEQRRETIVYYLGGLTAPNSGDVDLTVNIAQRAIRLGAIGAAIRVPRYIADELISKYNVHGKLVFSFDRNLATRAARGENLAQPKSLGDYTRAELLAALAELDEEVAGDQVVEVIQHAKTVAAEAKAVDEDQAVEDLAALFMDEEVGAEEHHQPIPAAVIPPQPEERVLTPQEKAAQTRAANKAKAVKQED